jgi:hypothetical protein
MSNFKKRKRYKRIPLACKYWYRGIAKSTYRKQRGKGKKFLGEEINASTLYR